MPDQYNSQLFSQLLSQNQGPTQGSITGGRPLGGLLPDFQVQPIINLQANGLFTGKAICTFGSASKAQGSKLSQCLQSMGDAFLKSIANTGIQAAPVDTSNTIQAPSLGGGSSWSSRVSPLDGGGGFERT